MATMTRRDWWIGVVLLVLAILAHALIPRFEIVSPQGSAIWRFDRWTGRLEIVGGANLDKAPWLSIPR